MNYNVVNKVGEVVKQVELNDAIFNVEYNQQCVFDAIMVARSNSRQATAKTKKRDEVRGGGRKPFRQKGTGRARQGSSREPQMVGGGVVFGPTGIQNFKIRQNKKAARLALKSVLTEKAHNEGLVVVDEFNFKEAKTKEFVKVLDAVKAGEKILFVANEEDDLTVLSARNLQYVKIVYPNGINVYDIANVDTLLVSESALKTIEEVFA
ncbi:MAG: 50S ribosomal protein L4 [Candidatus Caccosoma sp.]|nr:50S ribosomal protein L4 [Candidatus Caccosoma sp.]